MLHAYVINPWMSENFKLSTGYIRIKQITENATWIHKLCENSLHYPLVL